MSPQAAPQAPDPRLDVAIIGGGMITADVLLPVAYHFQRTGAVRDIMVCARHSAPLRALAENRELCEAFPGQQFSAYPALSEPRDRRFPEIWRQVLTTLPPRQAVVVAVPDQDHHEVVMAALRHDQHVLCVKPLVLSRAHGAEIERLARQRGLFVGVEYHKRFDRRVLAARQSYRAGYFGSFAIGEAKLIEPYFYRDSNFQNWFTRDQTDPFAYVGCQYVDAVHFITGLRPVAVSVSGVAGTFPNGNEAFFWANGRVRFENGALLSVTAGLGYPDRAAGSNDQGLVMYCEGRGATALLYHDDQDRGVHHCYLEPRGPGGSHFNYVNPDFLRFVPWEGAGLKPVGYGFESVSAYLNVMRRIEREAGDGVARRQSLIREVDAQGLLATPANTAINDLVVEAGRRSIVRDGAWVDIPHGTVAEIEPARID